MGESMRAHKPEPGRRRVARWLAAVACLAGVAVAGPAASYPLDGGDRIGIRRLAGYVADQAAEGRRKLPPGALLGSDQVALRLAGVNESWDLTEHDQDPELKQALKSIFAGRDGSYGVAVIDITDPENIAWAGVRDDLSQYPGSVGKTLCALAVFDGLRRAFPKVEERERVLQETVIEATAWAAGGSHRIPVYDPETGRNRHRRIAADDRFSLAEWIDHALSPSANGAGAVIWKEAMLLRRFGADYPPTREQETAFFAAFSPAELQRLSLEVIAEPLEAAGLDPERLRQGTFWTRHSQARIPGVRSFASPRELARLLLRLEQGRLVDAWSSRELKRYLYMTKKRYRYVYAPELDRAAVYFKSGSLYKCVAEEGFSCGRYRGNAKNYMNSIVIVETPAKPGPEQGQKRYIVALMSNVLRKNSAWDHSRLGAAIDEAVRERSPVEVDEAGSAAERKASGVSE